MLKSIALVGNPNCGKTTLFNRLTGANQKIGNWPGVTVEQYHGKYKDARSQEFIEVVDLPGCYSLILTPDISLDEKVTCDYIVTNNDVIYVNVIDASHLSRDLYLTTQLLELGVPVIVALNCIDLIHEAGIRIDTEVLSAQLGCPVFPIIAKNGRGVKKLQEFISSYKPHHYDNVMHAHVMQATEPPSDLLIAQQRRQNIKKILQNTVTKSATKPAKLSDKLDGIVLHKVFGPIIFFAVMYLMFTVAINIGGLLQVSFEHVSETLLVDGVQRALTSWGAASWFVNLMASGIGRGLSITITFMPVLAAMFLCLGILESSGYMARAAFIVDRAMRYLGLSGKSFVPMIVGFGCNVPAVMGTRTLANQRERILTIMMTPFMSCSARLAIYAIFVAAFFPTGGQNVIFSLYVIGIAVAVITALALRGAMNNTPEAISLMEMPDYRWPLLSALLRQVWQRLKGFLIKAGVLIVILSVIINGVGDEILANLGKYLTPLFAPIGIAADNWPATVGLLTGLIAKEAVIGTLNAFYSSEAAMVQSFGSTIAAYSYLLFTLLYFPCVSVVAVIAKELNFKWAAFSVIWSTGLAYIIAALFYQLATLNSYIWIIGLSSTLISFFVATRLVMRKQQQRIARRKTLPTPIGVIS